MVNTKRSLSWMRRMADELRRDTQGFLASFTPHHAPVPGMYTYRIHPSGGQQRIHLRIETDGSGVLFVDAAGVMHLNATAVEMAKFALDHVPLEEACAAFIKRFRDVNHNQVVQELNTMYNLINRLYAPENGCPTCAVAPITELTPLYNTRTQAPHKADIALTYGCNNACSHCYNEESRTHMTPLKPTEWYRVLDKLKSIGIPHIIFTGGEATLHPLLPELIRYAEHCGMIVGLNTNGRRLSDKSYVNSLEQAGLNHVQITIGSCYPTIHNTIAGTHSFEQTLQGIKNALDSTLHTITNTTLMHCNSDHVEEIITFLHNLGIRTFAMNTMINAGQGIASLETIPQEQLAPILLRVRNCAQDLGMRFLWYTPTEYCRLSPIELEVGAKRCNAGEYTICIEPNGSVLPCQSYYVSAGNILRDPWEHVWESKLFRRFRERNDNPKRSGLPEKCWECPDLPICGGGCPLEQHEGRKMII